MKWVEKSILMLTVESPPKGLILEFVNSPRIVGKIDIWAQHYVGKGTKQTMMIAIFAVRLIWEVDDLQSRFYQIGS
jgi:hypothetical protein